MPKLGIDATSRAMLARLHVVLGRAAAPRIARILSRSKSRRIMKVHKVVAHVGLVVDGRVGFLLHDLA